jgi:hypothetical protein
MICRFHNVVKVRKRDGRRFTVIRCADSRCEHFTKDVTEEQCKQCPNYIGETAQAAVPDPKTPNLAKRAVTWAQAVASWKLKGSPERSDEEVLRIYHQFCASTPPCRWFDSEHKRCKGCGCGVSPDGPAVFNKIKMATQHCPRGLW